MRSVRAALYAGRTTTSFLVLEHLLSDQDAIPVKRHRARRMLRQGGFSVLRTDYLFVFPMFLKSLRGLEPLLSHWPLGAQFLVLCRKE